MLKCTAVLLVLIVASVLISSVYAQTAPPAINNNAGTNAGGATSEQDSAPVSGVPAATVVRISPGGPPKANLNFAEWYSKAAAQNGLESGGVQPWHIVIAYDQFDEDGDKINTGVYEESWVGPKRYKRMYKSATFSQTDYATERGLFRLGDQAWPRRIEAQVRAEIIDPFSYALTLREPSARSVKRAFGASKFECVQLFPAAAMVTSDPTQYCFERGGAMLRYSRGWGWNQTSYNEIISFQGRNIARRVDVTNGGKPYLNLRVLTLDVIPQVNEADFVPPPEAVSLVGKPVSGVQINPLKTSGPNWPSSVRGQHFKVIVEIVIGKDGHVASAHAVSGPEEVRELCEEAARKWVYPPYRVLGEPVEVNVRVGFDYQ